MPRFTRHAWTLLAPMVVLASLCLAPSARAAAGDLPDLLQSPPSNVTGGYFDDHSIAGDNHLGWSSGASQVEPLAIDFTSRLTNRGAGALELCGYPPGAAGWMRAYQVASGALGNACPAGGPGPGQMGWFRWVSANHSSGNEFNRWHLTDLQRFALVPLPPALGGPLNGAATAWDTYWGTCLNLGDPSLSCTNDPGVASLDVGVAPGQTKVTQDGAPDDERIAIPAEARASFPDGAYQVVAISNPYGAISEAGTTNGSVACTTVTLANAAAYANFSVTVVGVPDTCYVPRALPAALTGPGGRDPMAGAGPTQPPCTLLSSGHCWATVPTSGTNPPAQSNVNAAAAQTVVGTDLVPVGQGADYRVTAPAVPPPAAKPSKRLTVRGSRAHVRSALRKQFGRNLRRLEVTCRVVVSTRSTCTVSWRNKGASYNGRVYLRLKTVKARLRWQYRVDVRKRQAGRSQRVSRSYRTGGVA